MEITAPPSLGRNTWKSLIVSQASLQPNCNKEGFNAVSGDYPHSRAIIGILDNKEDNCFSYDSRVGFGTGGKHDDSNVRSSSRNIPQTVANVELKNVIGSCSFFSQMLMNAR